MKILQIVNPVIPFPAKTIGGTERIVKYLIDELINNGHDVTLLCHNDSNIGAHVKTIGIGTYLNQKDTAKKVWKHLLFNKYDIIHNHGRLIHFLPQIYSSTRKIHTFHMADLETKSFHRFLNFRPRNFTFSPCSKWIQDKCAHLPGNWKYVYNGLPINLYSFQNKKIDDSYPLVIICRMGLGKGVLDAINVAIKTGRKLIIAGKIGDYPNEKKWFSDNIERYCDGDQISFIGTINDEQKNELLNTAAALIIPTLDSEAFNTTMIEANACGCPVISYNKFCFNEFIVDGINGYKGANLDGLINAVKHINNIDRAECRKNFEDHYTSKIMADNYVRLYNSKV